mmetsp:Transcript_47913/g.111778  ORF Transcript_47913/g.111778 Transcript_47913/m.111778 type:complete len:777 (-) Transcript_47913:35-2365(-)
MAEPTQVVPPINILLGEHRDLERLAQSKEELLDAVRSSYVTQYLEALRVDPTDPENRRMVSRFAPLQACKIDATWGDFNNSMTASALRIVPPARPDGESQQSAEATDKAFSGTQQPQKGKAAPRAAGRSKAWIEHAEMMDVTAPCVEEAEISHITTHEEEDERPEHLPEAVAEEIWRMRITGERRDGSDGDIPVRLTEELERMRAAQRAVPLMRPSHSDGQWRSADDGRETLLALELSELKKKFILPFAALRPPQEVPPAVQAQQGWLQPLAVEELVPFQLLQPESAPLHVLPELLQEAVTPITAVEDDTNEQMNRYVEERLPLHLLTTHREGNLLAAIGEAVDHPEITRFCGLFAHLVYWEVLGHTRGARKILPESARKSLLHSIYQIWATLTMLQREWSESAGHAVSGLILPVLVLVMKTCIEERFVAQYGKLFADNGRRRHLVEQINVLFMRHFDPDGTMAVFPCLDRDSQAAALWRKYERLLESGGLGRSVRSKRRIRRTTPVTRAILQERGEENLDARTRALLGTHAETFASPAHYEGRVHFASLGAVTSASVGPRTSAEDGIAVEKENSSRPPIPSEPKAALKRETCGGAFSQARPGGSAVGRKREERKGSGNATTTLRPPSAEQQLESSRQAQQTLRPPLTAVSGQAPTVRAWSAEGPRSRKSSAASVYSGRWPGKASSTRSFTMFSPLDAASQHEQGSAGAPFVTVPSAAEVTQLPTSSQVQSFGRKLLKGSESLPALRRDSGDARGVRSSSSLKRLLQGSNSGRPRE